MSKLQQTASDGIRKKYSPRKKLRITGCVLMAAAVLLLAGCIALNGAGIGLFYLLPYQTPEYLTLPIFFLGVTLFLFTAEGSVPKQALFGALGILAVIMTGWVSRAAYYSAARKPHRSYFTVIGLTVTANEKLTKDDGIIVTADIEIIPHILSKRGTTELHNGKSAEQIIQAVTYENEGGRLMVYVDEEPIFACPLGEISAGRPSAVTDR